MGWLDWLFKKKAGQTETSGKKLPEKNPVPVQKKQAPAKVYYEKDNRGTRQDTLSLASAYWISRQRASRRDPYVLYKFASDAKARAALLGVPCIKVASDSKKLICTDVLTFGYYPNEEGKHEAFLCGDDLTSKMWEIARASFIKNGGEKINEMPPQQKSAQVSGKSGVDISRVVYVRTDYSETMGRRSTYKIYKGPDAATAKAFLEKTNVTEKMTYVVVETPEGNYCRDIQGMYKE